MTEDYDFDSSIDVEIYSDWDDGMYSYEESYYDYRDCDEYYRSFYAYWDQDYPIYLIHLDIENDDYYYVKFTYAKTTELEIGRKGEILLRLDNSNFGREYFLVYDGEKISPKSREHFRSTVEVLVKLKNFL